MSDQLKPCPFCGGDAFMEENETAYEPYFSLGCNNANCAGHRVFDTWSLEFKDESIAKWNKRDEREVAELREALDKATVFVATHCAYIDFACFNYPKCGCASYKREDCAAMKGKP